MGVSVPSYRCMAYMPASKWGEATERESQSIKPMEGDADRSAKVGGAVEKIRDKMHSSIIDPVTRQDLRDVQSTIAGLPNEDASAVVCELSESVLRRMVEKVDNFKDDEKQAFFDTMAQKLDGKQLARVTNAFEGNSLSSMENMNVLGRSIAKNASDVLKLEYVFELDKVLEVLADQSSVQGKHFGILFSLETTKMSDPQARVASQVIASMDNAKAGQALGKLSSTGLDAVIRASADPTDKGAIISVIEYDLACFQKLMQAAAKMRAEVQTPEGIEDVADLKSLIFNSAANVLRDAESGHFLTLADTAAMRKGMYDILMSDVNGVMNELTRNDETRDGVAMAIYVKSAINAKEYDQLGDIQARLARGNDLKGDHAELFNSPDQNYMHASNAGYFVGAMGVAVTSISSDAGRQAAIVNALINSAAIAAGVVLPPAGGATAGIGATVGGLGVNDSYGRGVKNKTDPLVKLRKASLPVGSKRWRPNGEEDKETAYKPESFQHFVATWTYVQNNAQP